MSNPIPHPALSVSKAELLQAKRAVVVLAECFKASMGGEKAPLELRQDMLVLTKLLRRMEMIAGE